MRFFNWLYRSVARAWRFLSEADTVVSIFGYAGITVSAFTALVVAAWAYLEGAPLPAWILLFVATLGAALFATYWFVRLLDWNRQKDARALRERYMTTDEAVEMDVLDFIADGEQATIDINDSLTRFTKETLRINRKINYYAFRTKWARSMVARRKVVSNAARSMRVYADKVQGTSDFIGAVTPKIGAGMTRVIAATDVTSEAERNELRRFAAILSSTAKTTVPQTVKQIEGFRKATSSLKGVSGELNAASHHLAVCLGHLIGNIRAYGRICAKIEGAAQARLKQNGKSGGTR